MMKPPPWPALPRPAWSATQAEPPWSRGSEPPDHATIDAQFGAGDIAGACAGEEGDRIGEFLGPAVTAHRDRRLRGAGNLVAALALFLGSDQVELVDAVGMDTAGQHHVDGDALGGHLAGPGDRKSTRLN